MGITTFIKKIYYIFFCFTFILGVTKVAAQCPTVTNANQSFCDIQSPTVSSLVATNNGNGVVWYATANATTPLNGATGLVNGEDYFADNNTGTCGTRQSVVVTIFSAPTGQNFQGVCVGIASDATIADLIAVGNNIRWYATATSTNALPSNTILNDNTIYYASQTNPNTNCETSRLSVFVNVGVVPVPVGSALQQFCNTSGNTPTIANLVASGANNWYPTSTSAVVLDPSTPLVDGQSYFATTVDPPCESINRLEVVVDLVAPNNSGINGTRQICQNQVATIPPFNLFNLLGGTPDNTGTWSGPLPTTNGFQGTVNVSTLTLAGSPYVFTYSVTSSICAPSSSTVTITILPLPTASISGTTTICSGNNATVTFTGTPNATVTYTVTGTAGNQTIVLNASGSATIATSYNTNVTYTLVSVASQGTPSCSQPVTGNVTITVRPLPTVVISANATVCSGSSATVTFTGTPNATILYTISGVSGNQSIILNAAGTATISSVFLATTTYSLVSATSAGTPTCSQPQNGSVTITVIQLPIVTISGNVTICQNGVATITFTGPANATVIYTATGVTGNQTIFLNGSGTATITGNYATTTTFSLVSASTAGTPSCIQPQSGAVTIIVLPPPTATIAANTTICSGASATVTFTGTPNATITYTVTGVSGNQSILLNASGTATITNIFTATTTYTLVSVASAGTPSCTQIVTTSITITVLPLPIVSISQSTTICPNQQATVTFTGTPNAIVTYTVSGISGNQTISLNGSGTAAITNTYSTTTTFTLVGVSTAGTPSCSQPQSGIVTITVLPMPTATIASAATICSGGNAIVTFTGTPNSTVTYTVTGVSGNQTIILNGSGTASISNTYSTTTTFTLVSVASAGTPSCLQPLTGSITITVLPLPVVTIAAPITICSGNSATVTFTGTPNATVTFLISGIAGNQTIVLNASGTATVTNTYTTSTTFTLISVSTSGTPSCSQPQTGVVVITVLPPPTVTISTNATICAGGNATVTFTGTPNAIVTYTVSGTSGNQTIVLNASGTATLTNTYTISTTFTLVSVSTSGTPTCTQPQTGSMTVNVIQLPTATISGNVNICVNGTATITFTGTPNATVTYTVSGLSGNQTIVLNATGTATITGTYPITTTYTLVSVATFGTPSCMQPQSGQVVVTVLPPPTVVLSSNVTICSGDSATVTFTGTPNAIVTFTISGVAGNQTIILNGSGTATVVNTYSTTTTFTLVNAATSGTPGCTQPQTGTTIITVLPPPTVTITSNATICTGGSATVTFNGTPGATVTYTISGVTGNQSILLNGSGTAAITNTYSTTTTFTLLNIATSGMPSCSQPQTGSVTITVVPLPIVAITSNVTTICSGTSATVTFTGTANAIVTYTISGVAGNQTIQLSGSGTATLSGSYTTSTTFTLISVATTGTPSCFQLQTGSVTITTTPAPVAGNDVSSFIVCTNSAPIDLFTQLGPTAQPGGTWSPALASGTGVFNPAVDQAGTYTYTVNGNAPCPSDTASVTVSVLPPPNAGNDASANICSNANPQNLFLLLGTNAQSGGTWSPSLASGTGIFDPSIDVAGIYTYTITGSAPCGSDSAAVNVQITPGPNAGQDGALTLCVNSLPQNLFNYLNGTPQAGGVWSPTLSSGTGIFNPAVDPAGVYTYTFFGNQPCDNDTAIVTVTGNPIPNAGNNGNASLCTNTPPTDLIAFLTGNPQPGGIWSPTLASGTGVFNPLIDAAGIYTYSVGGNLCSTDTATVTVTITQAPIAGGPGATLNACITSTSVNLFTGLNGSQGAGTFADDDASGALSGNIFNPSAAGVGTYHFTYTVGGGVSPCQFDTATVTVIVSPQPNAGTFLGIQNVCTSAGTFDLSTLLNNAQSGGSWTDINNVAITNPLNVATLATGTYSYIYKIVNACGNDDETVQITILASPLLAIPNITTTTPICVGSNAVITLSGISDGSYSISYNLSGSNILANQSVNVAVSGGNGTFSIPSANISNIGTTTVTFVSIANTTSNCTTALSNVQINFVVNPISDINPANLVVSPTCFGSAVTLSITNETGLADGNYQFNYSIPNATPANGSTGIIAISQGQGSFTIPASNFPTATSYTITITGIISLSSGCNNLTENASATITILPTPDVFGATITAGNTCAGFTNEVFITNANNLPDGIYSIDYQLSGAGSATTTIAVTITSGSGSFIIPQADLTNAGNVTVTFTDVILTNTLCGNAANNFPSVTFAVTQLGTPTIIPQGNEFCETDNPTIQTLSASIPGTDSVVFYDAPTGGTSYVSTDLLVAGTTYYAAFITGSGCESPTRLQILVDLSVCDQDILIPDGFSPNGDGINDDFEIPNLAQLYPKFRLEIYNRYGNVLYKGNANTPNWKGNSTEGGIKIGDGIVPVGVYFYILEFNDGARKPVQGRLYLSR